MVALVDVVGLAVAAVEELVEGSALEVVQALERVLALVLQDSLSYHCTCG